MEKFNNWLQVSANVGILLGLIFVGLQLRQDQQLVSAQKQAESRDSIIEWQSAVMGEGAARALALSASKPEDLTDEDITVLIFYTGGLVNHLRRAARLEELGLYDSSWRDISLPGLAMDLGGNPVTRAILLSYQSDEEWLLLMQRIARKADPESSAAWLNSIRSAAEK